MIQVLLDLIAFFNDFPAAIVRTPVEEPIWMLIVHLSIVNLSENQIYPISVSSQLVLLNYKDTYTSWLVPYLTRFDLKEKTK